MSRRAHWALVAALACGCAATGDGARGARPQRGMVVCEQPLAAEVGAAILEGGGNAADAAVATALALAVVYPQAGNLGGGGFALWVPDAGEALALDFRETAPRDASERRFFDDAGAPLGRLLTDSPLGVGVPGSPRGLAELLARCGSGRFTLADLAAPAIALALDGFVVDARLAADLLAADDRPRLERDPAARALFYPGGAPLAAGALLVQPELAATLQRYAELGPEGFYSGDTSRALVDALYGATDRLPVGERWDRGWVRRDDLTAYAVKWRAPLIGTFRGRELITMPPPSSGGVILLQVAGVLDGFPLEAQRERALASGAADVAACGLDATAAHWWIEAQRRAFETRATLLGDPDFVAVPSAELVSRSWAARARRTISDRAGQGALAPPPREGSNTTHVSVLDSAGNAVALTTTLNSSFGSGILVPGAGFLLNNELDDFALAGGARNQYGLVGGAANALEAFKRPLSSMSPTVVRKGGRVELVLGSPGGPRIISAVITVLLRTLVYGETLADAVAAPRFHQQWSPAATWVEPGWPAEFLGALEQRGHALEFRKLPFASVQAIRVLPDGRVEGASDPRRSGAVRAQALGSAP